VLAHAPALAALCNPTINSYKRFGPDTLAPWLIDWGLDNRSAMDRIPPERGRRPDGAPARRCQRNPVLWHRGLLAARTSASATAEAARPLEGYGYDPSKADQLPGDLATALARSRPTPSWPTSSATVRRDFPDLQAAMNSSASTMGDRLGVPRVRLPPVIVKDPTVILKSETRRDRVTTTPVRSIDVDLTDLDAFARNEAGASSTRCAREDPVHWTPEHRRARLLGRDPVRGHRASTGSGDLHLDQVRQSRGRRRRPDGLRRSMLETDGARIRRCAN
jgi:hypothetical protein